ncbi:MAG: YfhO family protein [Lachnospiraceae bacterium]
MKNMIKKNWNYIIVFLIPWLLIVLHSIVRESWLMGQGSLLNGDTCSQLLPLMFELWDKVHSGESLFFSWNAGNGFDFYLNMIYYLISPFNLIILLLPKGWIVNTFQFVMVLKWSLMGLSVTYYFMHTRYNTINVHKKLLSSVLGIAFVLSNAILTIIGYLNWGDVIILFPFIVLEFERLMETGNWKKYYVLLTIAMLCNFYMAYQVCIFLVLWFFVNLSKDIDKKINKFFLFAGSSILAAISSCVVILPAALGAVNRYNGRKLDTWINNIYGIGEKLFLFSEGLVDWKSYKPNIYFSIGFFIFFLLFFFAKNNKIKKGKLYLVWAFMFVSLFSGILTVFWHGFSVPYGVYHRYLYMLIFLMLCMAMETIISLQTISKLKLILATVFEMVFMAICFFRVEYLNDFWGYLLTFLLLILYNLLLYFYLKGSIQYKNIIVVTSILVLLETCANAFYELKEYNISDWDNIAYNSEIKDVSKEITLDKGDRISMPDSLVNTGLVLNLPSTNQFTSYSFDNMSNLYNNLGMEFDSSTCVASGTSPLLNLMFNIKYGIGEWEGDFSDTELLKSSDNLKLYQINRLAGLGYMVNEDVLNWNTDEFINFNLQNDYVKKAVDGEDIFTPVMPKAKFTDGTLMYNYSEDNYQRGYYYYDYISKTIAETEMTEFSFTVDEDMDLYMDTFSQKPMKNVIYIDDEFVCSDKTDCFQRYYHIGNVKKGQKVNIYSLHSMGVGEESVLWFRFAKFNEENYAKAYEKLSKNVYDIDTMNATYISGTIHSDEDSIMMTSIPAMNGFSVYVDGEKTDFEKIGDALIGVPLTAGDHKVEFKYMTPYFIPGLITSLIGILIFVSVCIYDSRKKKQSGIMDELEQVAAK